MLEIGSGGSPAVAFAALRHCRRIVATDGSPEALRLLERNVCANARSGLGHKTFSGRCCKAASAILHGWLCWFWDLAYVIVPPLVTSQISFEVPEWCEIRLISDACRVCDACALRLPAVICS